MKKLYFFLALLGTFSMYCQEDYDRKISDVKTEAKANEKEKKRLKKKISNLNNKIDSKFIDTTQTIIYDFRTKKYKKSNVIPVVGEPLVFKIENINRLAYEITIKSEDVAIADEYFNPKVDEAAKVAEETTTKKEAISEKKQQDLSFDTTSFKTGQNLLISNASELNNLSKETSSLNQQIIEKENLFSANKKELEALNGRLTDINTAIEVARTMGVGADDKIAEKNRITTSITAMGNLNQNLAAEINSLNSLLATENARLESLSKLFYDFKMKYDNLMESYSRLVASGNSIIKIENKYMEFRSIVLNPLLDKASYIEKKKNSDLILYQLESSKNEVIAFEGQLNNFYNQYNIAINDWAFFDSLNPDARENIRNRYQIIKDEVDTIKKDIDTENLKGILIKVSSIDEILMQDNAYVMVSSPIQPLEDYITFDINIKHRDEKKQSEYNDNREFTYMEYTQGGVRFDFSTGVVFNFGNDNTYELSDVVIDNTSYKKVVTSDNNHFTPFLAGMFHTSFRRNGIWSMGLTLGASINVETFELNSLFPGISLLIGKKQKFIVTAGPAFRQVETLKDTYENNGLYDPSSFNEDTQLSSSQFRIGFFFGITYNLTQKQRAKFKIGSN